MQPAKQERISDYSKALSEQDVHMFVMSWARLNAGFYPALKWIMHVPNESPRTPWYGAKLKQMGMKKGFPDLFLPYPSAGFHGWAAELKRPGGSLTKEQKNWLDYLSQAGYCARWFSSGEECVKELELYLKGH